MYSQFHRQIVKANPPLLGPQSPASGRPDRAEPPPRRRLRGHAAYALASAAQRLDGERARRAIA